MERFEKHWAEDRGPGQTVALLPVATVEALLGDDDDEPASRGDTDRAGMVG